MVRKYTSLTPQLELADRHASHAVVLTNESKISLYKKSMKSGIGVDVLEEVYRRGYSIWNESFAGTPEQFAFDRVNSFIAGGFAAKLDEDLMTEIKKPTGDLKDACWKGYTAVGMKMKNGKKVPNCVPVKEEESLLKTVKRILSDDTFSEAVDMSDDRSKWIKDFVNSDNERFKGKSKKERIRMALGAYYAAQAHRIKEESIEEATYKGKKVPLNKPMKGDVKKSKVFVDPDGDGIAKKVNFGDKKLSIKKHMPNRKKSYCARSSGQGNLTDKSSANYWSRRAWDC